jgi:hypothetical protein
LAPSPIQLRQQTALASNLKTLADWFQRQSIKSHGISRVRTSASKVASQKVNKIYKGASERSGQTANWFIAHALLLQINLVASVSFSGQVKLFGSGNRLSASKFQGRSSGLSVGKSTLNSCSLRTRNLGKHIWTAIKLYSKTLSGDWAFALNIF